MATSNSRKQKSPKKISTAKKAVSRNSSHRNKNTLAKRTKPDTENKDEVEIYMRDLKNPFKAEINVVRAIIKSTNKNIQERIKWNAPSYFYKDDLVTFNGWATKNVHLVFHHPNIVKIKSPLLEGSYDKRRMVYFSSLEDIRSKEKELKRIINALVRSVANQKLHIMKKEFKPEGYNSLSPYFIVNGAEKLSDLLKKIFNARELRKYPGEKGSIMHMEIQIDDSVIMLSDATDQYPANQLLLHVYVEDVHETYKRAIAAGCEGVEVPVNKPGDPDMRGMFKDFAGNMWAIGTQL